jgi:hypothetical protein
MRFCGSMRMPMRRMSELSSDAGNARRMTSSRRMAGSRKSSPAGGLSRSVRPLAGGSGVLRPPSALRPVSVARAAAPPSPFELPWRALLEEDMARVALSRGPREAARGPVL